MYLKISRPRGRTILPDLEEGEKVTAKNIDMHSEEQTTYTIHRSITS